MLDTFWNFCLLPALSASRLSPSVRSGIVVTAPKKALLGSETQLLPVCSCFKAALPVYISLFFIYLLVLILKREDATVESGRAGKIYHTLWICGVCSCDKIWRYRQNHSQVKIGRGIERGGNSARMLWSTARRAGAFCKFFSAKRKT